jgi:hypothetical protein
MATSDLAVDAALDAALGEEAGNSKTMTSNTDEKLAVWEVATGEKKEILKIDARRVLRKKLSDGRLAHWIPDFGGSAPVRSVGSIKCYLHPEFDEKTGASKMDRAFIDEIGLAGLNCNSGDPSNNNRGDFTSILQRDRHMRMRHSDAWQVILDARATAERNAEAEERRADREVMIALASKK